MTNKALNISNFQTFYVSKEVSNCPLVADIFKFIKKSKDITISSISLRYGKRVLINTKNTDFKEIEKEDFIEIVDYDPFKNVLLVMGPGEPVIDTPLHWFIHHAREDVNAVLIINKDSTENIDKKLPVINKNGGIWPIEKIKEILGLLRNSKTIVIKNKGLLLVGKNIDEIEKNLS